jgi:hypothetical protein
MWSKEYALTTHAALGYRPKKKKPVTTRKVSEAESNEDEVEVIKQKTPNTDAHDPGTSMSVRKLLRVGSGKHVGQINITLTEPHHPAVKQLRTPVVAVIAVHKFDQRQDASKNRQFLRPDGV